MGRFLWCAAILTLLVASCRFEDSAIEDRRMAVLQKKADELKYQAMALQNRIKQLEAGCMHCGQNGAAAAVKPNR
jgi:hypothetical protein